jgi:hypothetical protein
MTDAKFIVEMDRGGTHAGQYVPPLDRNPVKMTFNRNPARMMGKLAAEDTVKSVRNFRGIPEVVSVEVVS